MCIRDSQRIEGCDIEDSVFLWYEGNGGVVFTGIFSVHLEFSMVIGQLSVGQVTAVDPVFPVSYVSGLFKKFWGILVTAAQALGKERITIVQDMHFQMICAFHLQKPLMGDHILLFKI